MPSQRDIESYAKKQGGGKVIESYQSPRFVGFDVLEVWVDDEVEYFTRFVTVDSNGQMEYFDGFQSFIGRMAELCQRIGAEEIARLRAGNAELKAELDALRQQSGSTRHAHRLDLIKLLVPAVVFLASTITLLYMVSNRIEPNNVTYATFASLIGSGAFMFFGKWMASDSPASPPKNGES